MDRQKELDQSEPAQWMQLKDEQRTELRDYIADRVRDKSFPLRNLMRQDPEYGIRSISGRETLILIKKGKICGATSWELTNLPGYYENVFFWKWLYIDKQMRNPVSFLACLKALLEAIESRHRQAKEISFKVDKSIKKLVPLREFLNTLITSGKIAFTVSEPSPYLKKLYSKFATIAEGDEFEDAETIKFKTTPSELRKYVDSISRHHE